MTKTHLCVYDHATDPDLETVVEFKNDATSAAFHSGADESWSVTELQTRASNNGVDCTVWDRPKIGR